MNLQISPIPAFKDNYIWLITKPNNKFAVVVDPGDANPVLTTLEKLNLNLAAILVTHHHFDHRAGIPGILQHISAPVFGPKHPELFGLSNPVGENDLVIIPELELTFKTLAIPGHTLEHVAYYGHELLFCGDTLFAGGCGRLFEGTAEQLYHSLARLAALPKNIAVYCGHEYTQHNLLFAQEVEPNNQFLLPRIIKTKNLRQKNLPTLPSTIDEEKNTNPFLRCEKPTVIENAEKYAGKKLQDPIEVFASLRQWKNDF